MDLELPSKDTKAAASVPKMICAGCDLEVVKSKEDDYFSECADCGSHFCSDCDLLIIDSLRFCPVCQE